MRPFYTDDFVTLYHGDCREIAPQLDLSAVDVVIADPPYGQTSLAWDRWPTGWLDSLGDVRSLWCFGSLRLFMWRAAEFAGSGWQLSQDIVWEKHNGSSFHADRFRRVHEQAAHFYRGNWVDVYHVTPKTLDATARTVRRKGHPAHMGHIDASAYKSIDGGPRLMRSVIFARSMHGQAENETQKPEGIVAPLVEYACPARGTIMAPFAGSGTDLEVAKLTGRRAIGIEVRESQCESAARRLMRVLPLEASA